MRNRSSLLARALVVAGASVFIVVGAAFGANALKATGQTMTGDAPAASAPAATPEPVESAEPGGTGEQGAGTDPAEAAEPAETSEPAETTEQGASNEAAETADPAAASGAPGVDQGQNPADSDGEGGAVDGD